MSRRPSLGAARFYVATLVVVLIAVALFAFARSQERPATSPAPSTGQRALSPLDEALQGVRDDGTWSKETALAAFAAAFGPVPGVPTPRADPAYHSGTLALRMVEAYWSELTGEQKAAIKDYIGPAAAAVIPAAYHPGHPEFARLSDTYQGIADTAAADIGATFGRPLGIPINVVTVPKDDPGGAWVWAQGNWGDVPAGSHASRCIVSIPPATLNDQSRAPFMRWLLLHEVWHCFEYTMTDEVGLKSSPGWVTEGEASWVAEAITGGVGAPPPEADHWDHYILDPGKPLYSREYDAVGFYAQLFHNSINPWYVLEPMFKAGGSDAAFQASGASAPTFTDRWGSSWFRDAKPTIDWAMGDAYGIRPVGIHAVPSAIAITDGADDTISAKPNAGAIADVHTVAFITQFEVSGVGRVADPGGGTLDKVIRAGTLDLCTDPSGDCTCSPGSEKDPTPPDRAPENLHAAASGEQRNSSVMNIHGTSKDDWCKPRATPSPPQNNPCSPAGCGGSNGDPHMRTIDGIRYDLQAAGEYVLLRSADGAVEVQGRQERPGDSGNATIGSAVAVRVNTHRVGFYAAPTGPPEVHVDGVVVDAAKAASADLGTGARLAAYQRGYELDLPDGTKVWALSVGHWGINLLVLPSAALRASGVGLIAHVPPTAGYRVPAMPDGSTFKVPIDRHEKFHDLYEVLAPAWRVTTSSLFDYAAGKTTDSYTLAGFPPEAVPQTSADLDQTALSGARTKCAGVTDPDLADQCAYDVAVTGSPEYATLYGVTQDLQTQGTTSLSQPPGATPPPPPGGPTAGINLVADHLAGIGASVLGPDGTLYVYVVEGVAFGDTHASLLAVDTATGKVRTKAAAVAVGGLGWAAGSLWAGEFNRSDKVWCEVSRLDPVTLAVQAQVPTICSDQGRSSFGVVGDAIWFIDGTGAAANGTGAHLRRIDPATNKVDPNPGGNLDLPYLPPGIGIPTAAAILASTSAGLIVGDRHNGIYRLSAGSDSFEQIVLPATASTLFPTGAGVWTQTEVGTSGAPEGVVTFATGDPASDVKVGINGYLVGADDSAVYATPPLETQQLDELWRYPTDGGAPTRLAQNGLVPNPFGGQPLMAPLRPPPRRNIRWKSRKRAIGIRVAMASAARKMSSSVAGCSVGSRTDSGWMFGFRRTRSGHR